VSNVGRAGGVTPYGREKNAQCLMWGAPGGVTPYGRGKNAQNLM